MRPIIICLKKQRTLPLYHFLANLSTIKKQRPRAPGWMQRKPHVTYTCRRRPSYLTKQSLLNTPLPECVLQIAAQSSGSQPENSMVAHCVRYDSDSSRLSHLLTFSPTKMALPQIAQRHMSFDFLFSSSKHCGHLSLSRCSEKNCLPNNHKTNLFARVCPHGYARFGDASS